LFSPPVRRLANKTQVFPLEADDAVRNRLTHSHEVVNLARSMGDRIVVARSDELSSKAPTIRAILSAVGIAHDLGNPPFGHQGEVAIGDWFRGNEDCFSDSESGSVPKHLRNEFLMFEGNAQTMRVVTRLQVSSGGNGLDLTAGTLAALMKYTVSADGVKDGEKPSAKYGYFESETDVIAWIREKTGIREGQRHPLTWIMEAGDDIAYSSLDIEDAMRKRLPSPDDVLYEISAHGDSDVKAVAAELKESFKKIDRSIFSIQEIREIKSSYFRTVSINHMIKHAVDRFISEYSDIMSLKHRTALLDGCELHKLLKDLAFSYAFDSKYVRKTEADGAVAIHNVMSFFWDAIRLREKVNKLSSRRTTAAAAYGWSLISDNYKQRAIRNSYKDRDGKELPVRYQELRLLTDMMSGMTDGYLMSLNANLIQAGHVSC
jgi:dGTPase